MPSAKPEPEPESGTHHRDTLEVGVGTGSRSGRHVDASTDPLLDHLRANLIGNHSPITTPFGPRPLVYADYTASGRSLAFLEDNIRRQVLPFYANTHSDASHSGRHSNALRESARNAIRCSVNGGHDDCVIFCGSGATAAINTLVAVLGLRSTASYRPRSGAEEGADRPVVFIGPYEHHSNELPWRESIADVVRIPLNSKGQIDQAVLQEALAATADRPLRIGSFSAASNVTGVCSDVEGITRQLKQAGALAFWDYAAGGPYLPIDVNAVGAPIDAVFISPHKFIGGPGTPGVLVVKRALMTNPVPAMVGGGTVAYVSPSEHRYLEDPEHREEGGTPAIIESIRAGAVFALKDRIGTRCIAERERSLAQRGFEAFEPVPSLEILGPRYGHRLPIFSLRIKAQHKELHYGFVAALLNDLFGIQARGGCSCAGPYGHDLLGIGVDQSTAIDRVVATGLECFKPGWVRLNLHYTLSDEECQYLLEAVRLVATHGWRLLPSYELDPSRGLWRHRDSQLDHAPDVSHLLDTHSGTSPTATPPLNALLAEVLGDARQRLIEGAPLHHRHLSLEEPGFGSDAEQQRWFLTSREAAIALGQAHDGTPVT